MDHKSIVSIACVQSGHDYICICLFLVMKRKAEFTLANKPSTEYSKHHRNCILFILLKFCFFLFFPLEDDITAASSNTAESNNTFGKYCSKQ